MTRAPVEITSKNGNAALMAAEDYAAWQETAPFRSPENARTGLLDSYEEVLRGLSPLSMI